MLKLKEFNLEDIKQEYELLQKIPPENGFENEYYNCTIEDFYQIHAPKILNNSKGIDLKPGYVPGSYYFLWDDNKIVGLVKIRYYLNDHLRKGAGHIGYAVPKEYQGKGYASKGLALAIKLCKYLIKEDEIYFSVHKDNKASLKVQLKNGAYITGENKEEYFTRIKLNK